MEKIYIVVVTSASVHLEKLNRRLYQEMERDGHCYEVTELDGYKRQSIHVFRNLKNPEMLAQLLRSYETLDNTTIYSGKVLSMKQYYIHGERGPEGRLKIEAEDKHLYDLPLDALEQLGFA